MQILLLHVHQLVSLKHFLLLRLHHLRHLLMYPRRYRHCFLGQQFLVQDYYLDHFQRLIHHYRHFHVHHRLQ